MKKPPIPKTPATEWELVALQCLQAVTYCPASFDKRFARDMRTATELTVKQREQIWRMCWRYRRQISSKLVVEMARAQRPTGNQQLTNNN